jgi:hypothetical protein
MAAPVAVAGAGRRARAERGPSRSPFARPRPMLAADSGPRQGTEPGAAPDGDRYRAPQPPPPPLRHSFGLCAYSGAICAPKYAHKAVPPGNLQDAVQASGIKPAAVIRTAGRARARCAMMPAGLTAMAAAASTRPAAPAGNRKPRSATTVPERAGAGPTLDDRATKVTRQPLQPVRPSALRLNPSSGRSCLQDGLAAGDGDPGAGDVAGLVRGEHHVDRGDLGGLSRTAER